MAKYNIYSIRDRKVAFGTPFPEFNNESAQRGFSYQLHNNSVMGFSPADYSLYRVGTFDSDSGQVEGCLPEFVCEGSMVVDG